MAQPPDYHGKLTVGEYAVEDESDLDVNVRYTVGDWSGWLGYFDSREIGQLRLGLEYDLREHWLYTVPSVQLASHGFVGGSMYSEIGTRLFLIAGASRTNLKPYFNLTFDPNESWQLGAGTHMGAADTIALYCIWDNRLDTGQQITHATLRHYLAKSRRLTADAHRRARRRRRLSARDAESVDRHGTLVHQGGSDEHANFGLRPCGVWVAACALRVVRGAGSNPGKQHPLTSAGAAHSVRRATSGSIRDARRAGT